MRSDAKVPKLLLLPVAVIAAAGLCLAALAGAEDRPTVRGGAYEDPTCDNAQQTYDTRITKAPKKKTQSKSATIRFEAFYCNFPSDDGPDSDTMKFVCSLDGAKPKACEPPIKYRHLKKGKHKVAVRTTGGNFGGSGDPSADVAKWKIVG